MYRDWKWQDGDFAFTPRGDAALAEGMEVLRQDLLARLVSPRGSHWAFPLEGSGLLDYVGAPLDDLTRTEVVQEAERTCLEDARVLEAAGEWAPPGLRLVVRLSEEALELLLPWPLEVTRG
ncbi:hypothetical protein TTHN1_00671 [Thermus thermophilus]|uniref:Uncharacterized protein n=1 Tax=Thermus thermophilus TaxID=274 RepID=A0A3P4AQK2_THETH|nr:hypothetical protein [Thermus thermophilus]VCU52916.1 hypothetical protein TTHN1_00671 [Thermus thermophilus]